MGDSAGFLLHLVTPYSPRRPPSAGHPLALPIAAPWTVGGGAGGLQRHSPHSCESACPALVGSQRLYHENHSIAGLGDQLVLFLMNTPPVQKRPT